MFLSKTRLSYSSTIWRGVLIVVFLLCVGPLVVNSKGYFKRITGTLRCDTSLIQVEVRKAAHGSFVGLLTDRFHKEFLWA
jgi:hypothetical protein